MTALDSSAKAKILIVDDEILVTDGLAFLLEKNGFNPVCVNKYGEAINALAEVKPDVVLLDLFFKGESGDGLEICKNIREHEASFTVPILVISAFPDVSLKVKALEHGADDFIPKPYHPDELIARIKAILRRTDGPLKDSGFLELGNLVYNEKKMEVRIEDELVALTSTELRLLLFFLRHVDSVCTKHELLDHIWAETQISSRTLDAHITNLRKKLVSFNRSIETRHGQGYILRSSAN